MIKQERILAGLLIVLTLIIAFASSLLIVSTTEENKRLQIQVNTLEIQASQCEENLAKKSPINMVPIQTQPNDDLNPYD